MRVQVDGMRVQIEGDRMAIRWGTATNTLLDGVALHGELSMGEMD
jgi:hypothetical protein